MKNFSTRNRGCPKKWWLRNTATSHMNVVQFVHVVQVPEDKTVVCVVDVVLVPEDQTVVCVVDVVLVRYLKIRLLSALSM